jgi:hypothetical protein
MVRYWMARWKRLDSRKFRVDTIKVDHIGVNFDCRFWALGDDEASLVLDI